MLSYPSIDPVAFALGPVKVHWYGLMYLLGFIGFLMLGSRRAQQPNSPIKPEQVADMLFYCVLGVIAGGRIGSVFFYNFTDFLADPLMIIRIWEGGMSFHGGLIGVIVAMIIYARKLGIKFIQLTDFGAPMVPIGLGFGRIGNFINGELWGRVTDVPWAMAFPRAGPEPRHPSQLYEFALEGIVMFTVLWLYSRKPRPIGAVSGLFLILYGAFRFAVEFVREPDAHIGFLAFDWLTVGQLLSLPMIIAGIWLMASAREKPVPQTA